MDKKIVVKPRRGIKIICFIIIFLVIVFVYGMYIHPKGFVTKEIAIKDESLSASYNGFKIVQFSDIHYGRSTNEETLKKLVDEINLIRPDVLVFTGDLFDDKKLSDKELKLIKKYFSLMEARLFKFAVIGDYDKKYLDEYKSLLEESNFILLDNEEKLVYDNSSEAILFVGLTNTTNIDSLYKDYFTITLVHKPDSILDIKDSNIVLAGHSLGGQIRIPFIGGIIKRDGAKTYIDTYYDVSGKKLYISNGVGTQDIKMRLFNKPSITLYRLYQN